MTVPWFDLPLAGFDCETTGTDPETARIVTAAVVKASAGTEPQVFTVLIDPGCEIPEEAAAVHGITTEKARAEGMAPAEALAGVRTVLGTLVEAGCPLCIFNARFDLTVLDREFRRHGLDPLPPAHVVDPFVIDKQLDRYRRGSRKLDAVCQHYRAGLDGAHDAGSDALAACRLAWRIGRQGRVVRGRWDDEATLLNGQWVLARDDLPALHAVQIEWAREQAISLREHFARQGDAAKGRPEDVALDWPMVPFREVVDS